MEKHTFSIFNTVVGLVIDKSNNNFLNSVAEYEDLVTPGSTPNNSIEINRLSRINGNSTEASSVL